MDWSKCPYCGSEDIEADEYDCWGGQIGFKVWCRSLECKKWWWEVYEQSHRESEDGNDLS